MITGVDHVQLAMPRGREDAARSFYAGLLGMTELAKPPVLAARGGCWFASGAAVLHLGVEEPFAPARKAHPALLVDDLDGLPPMKRISSSFLPPIAIDHRTKTPMYRQLYDWFRKAIIDGRLRPGQRVPSTRGLALELKISRIPVVNA